MLELEFGFWLKLHTPVLGLTTCWTQACVQSSWTFDSDLTLRHSELKLEKVGLVACVMAHLYSAAT